MVEKQQPLLFLAPRTLLDEGVQMVVPSFSALLANSAGEVLSDTRPFARAGFLDEADYKLILQLSPGSFDKLGIQHLLPSVKTLNICPVF